ncbi:hypothetical protein [Nocardia sp. NPDC047038]
MTTIDRPVRGTPAIEVRLPAPALTVILTARALRLERDRAEMNRP